MLRATGKYAYTHREQTFSWDRAAFKKNAERRLKVVASKDVSVFFYRVGCASGKASPLQYDANRFGL